MKFGAIAAIILGAIAGITISLASASSRPANILLFACVGAAVGVALYLLGRRI